MRRSILVAAAASVALVLGACGSDAGETPTNEPTTDAAEATDEAEETEDTEEGEEETEAPPVRGDEDLVIWTDEGKLDAITAVAEAFGEANGITVGVQAIVNTRADFITANQAGNGPDVLVGAHDWIGQLVVNGAIDPLQISADGLSGYSETAVQAVTYDGQLMGLPWGVESLVLYANTEYAPDTYDTLDEVIEVGLAAKDAGSVSSALNVQQGTTGDPYHMQPVFTAAGGYLFGQNEDGTYNADDLGVGTDAGIAAGEKIAELGEAGSGVLSTSITAENSISLFASGDAAFLISGPWALNDVTAGLGEDGFSVQPIPGFEGLGDAAPFMTTNAFYVASNGKNKTFAQAFITGTTPGSLNTVEAMTTLYELNHQPPAMTEVRETVAAENEYTAVFAEATDSAQPMPAIPAMDQVWTPLGQAYVELIGGADAETAMTTAAKTIVDSIAGS